MFETINKTPLKSKKFLFAILSEILILGLIAFIAFYQTITWPITAVLIFLSIGSIVLPVGYVLGLVALEKVAHMVDSASGIFGGKINDSDTNEDVD